MISTPHSAATRRSTYPAATRRCDSAAERRHDVAMGVSPWNAGPICGLSPNGTTGRLAPRIRVALAGLRCVTNTYHGLTPVATAYRPFGTESQGKPPRLVAELLAQFVESAKLEEAIKANLKGLGYGG